MDVYTDTKGDTTLIVRAKNCDAHRREKYRAKIETFFAKLKDENPEVTEVHWTVKNGD